MDTAVGSRLEQIFSLCVYSNPSEMSHLDLKKLTSQDLAELGHRVLTEMSLRAIMSGSSKDVVHQHVGSTTQPEVDPNAPMEASTHVEDKSDSPYLTMEEFTGGTETPPELIAALKAGYIGPVKIKGKKDKEENSSPHSDLFEADDQTLSNDEPTRPSKRTKQNA